MPNPPPATETAIRPDQNPSKWGSILYIGFAAALAVWCTWFITHLPWLGIPESISMPVILAVWLIAATAAGLHRPMALAARTGAGAGLLTALLGLLILGSKVSNPAPGFEALQPPILLSAAGFLTLGAVVGLVGALLGSALPVPALRATPDFRSRFAILTAIAIAPLLIIGGLVTSTNSGMAVPDWPNTFGSNMFLYPLGPRAAPDVYFEHSHRLFGAFVGITTIVLMVWVTVGLHPMQAIRAATLRKRRFAEGACIVCGYNMTATQHLERCPECGNPWRGSVPDRERLAAYGADPRRWMKFLVILAFVLVCIQGILGGIRVLDGSAEIEHDSTAWRMVHGILAQLVFGLIVGIAVALTPTFRRLSPPTLAPVGEILGARALRFYTTGFLHAMLFQLVLGAWFRHARVMHILWTHAAFALIVVIFATAAGFAAANIKEDHAGAGPILRRTGQWIVAVVALQFILGWVTFGFGGLQLEPDDPYQAIIRTAHQANGALTLALSVIAFVWMRRLLRTARVHNALAPAPAMSPAV